METSLISTHTPTHNLIIYGQVVCFLLALSSISLAEHIRARFLQGHKITMLQVKIAIEAIVIGLGLYFGMTIPISTHFYLYGFLGLACGYLIVNTELMINRHVFRNTKNHARPVQAATRIQAKHNGIGNAASSTLQDKTHKRKLQPMSYHNLYTQMSACALLLSAVSEELIYRGILLQFVTPYLAGIVFIILIFGLSHIFLGWLQVLIKTGMATLLTLLVIMTQDITPAIVAHLVLNVMAIRMIKTNQREIGYAV